MEICIGCGAEAETHPIVGIQKEGLKNQFGAKPIEVRNEHQVMPVCNGCWQNPEHRKTDEHRLKAAFFLRQNAKLAVRLANLPAESEAPIGGSTIPRGQ